MSDRHAVWSWAKDGRHAVELGWTWRAAGPVPWTWRLIVPGRPEIQITLDLPPDRVRVGFEPRFTVHIHVPKPHRWSRSRSFRVGIHATSEASARYVCRQVARAWVNGLDDPATTMGRAYWVMVIDLHADAAVRHSRLA